MSDATITVRFMDIRKTSIPEMVNVTIGFGDRLLNIQLSPEQCAKPFFVEGAAGEFIPDLIDEINQALTQEGE